MGEGVGGGRGDGAWDRGWGRVRLRFGSGLGLGLGLGLGSGFRTRARVGISFKVGLRVWVRNRVRFSLQLWRGVVIHAAGEDAVQRLAQRWMKVYKTHESVLDT